MIIFREKIGTKIRKFGSDPSLLTWISLFSTVKNKVFKLTPTHLLWQLPNWNSFFLEASLTSFIQFSWLLFIFFTLPKGIRKIKKRNLKPPDTFFRGETAVWKNSNVITKNLKHLVKHIKSYECISTWKLSWYVYVSNPDKIQQNYEFFLRNGDRIVLTNKKWRNNKN